MKSKCPNFDFLKRNGTNYPKFFYIYYIRCKKERQNTGINIFSYIGFRVTTTLKNIVIGNNLGNNVTGHLLFIREYALVLRMSRPMENISLLLYKDQVVITIPYNKSLHSPSPVVTKCKPVQVTPQPVHGYVPTILSILLKYQQL